ncbi:hypothetical protein QBC47DRAFT_439932 [Echria macrotheca]|uniref:Cell wall mannoprotein n=1 Tax=Echria macrotheca TaxID=438768 RepID=A0AAJ0B2Y0_9PEZI|nr:hypothetical protein QBC47DRAFT_439932 [Echria macrotheca]
MKYEYAMLGLVGAASARDISFYTKVAKREVPQEHSHQAIIDIVNQALQLNNPLEIKDAVFALLGNKAAAEGAPNVANLDCLEQIVADQAFTNGKAAGNLEFQANAILFRALERNTGSVGLASVLCNETAVNPEIAAITQHQDPASKEAAGNADIELAVAAQLQAIGADPNLALTSGTFAPGQIGDPTAKGNTCDDANDKIGCIISQNLLTPAVSKEQIAAAVSKAGGAASAGASKAGAADAACQAAAAPAAAAPASEAAKAPAADAAASAGGSATVNVQAFSGALGGPAPPVESTAGAERPFAVNGATFLNQGAAIQRSCAVQKNACANAANSGQLDGGAAQCDAQEKDCLAANSAKKRRSEVRRRQAAALDFGSCSNPAIEFADGLDGRKEKSFKNVNTKDFDHGSALNIKVVADFTCDRLASNCKADAAAIAACKKGAADAQAAGGKVQAAADAFNKALGVSA